MPNLAFGRVGNCLLLVHGEQPPEDAEWDQYLRFLEEQRSEKVRLLVSTSGAGPTAAQRGRLRAVVDREYPNKKLNTAILTGSMMARGIVTAVSWFNPSIVAFEPSQLPAALRYLGLPPDIELDISKAIVGLRRRLTA